MATVPLEVVGQVCTIQTHRPGPNLLGPIIHRWWQAASRSTAAAAAAAAGALACTPVAPLAIC